MDVLADALAAMRAGPVRSARTEVRGPWGLRFPAITGASFHVVLQGSCWLLPDGGGEPLQLGTGHAVFLRHGSAHVLADDPATPPVDFRPGRWKPGTTIGRVEIDGPGERALLLCGAYQLGRSRPHPLTRELPDVLHVPPGQRALGSTIDLLSGELEDYRPGRDGIVPALVDAMLLYILRAWADERAGAAPGGWASAITDPAISAALAALHEEPGRLWTVQELGSRAGLSRSAFAERFTGLVGEPPLTYLTWWRMTTAARLLLESDAPLSAVAAQVGYQSEFAFAKAFKREYGLAPGRYRRAERSQAG
ncbi:AraC family transcriptional regulator [Actinomadura rupiterrae]|uniref:AraC family transcriptional regulator n=1 Tax=Actinomadura rupiterrae TaxID=559627 RepID=UPI0020A578BD|nr:AraC family transcriptional regulator [Actinomadura rupiterrae]MCP2342740.1 AraC-like DNA-binding protein [Actinomadura rupiterrae]